MTHSPIRRTLLLAAASVPFAAACTSLAGRTSGSAAAQERLAALESAAGGRLGVAALNTANGAQLSHRANEHFALCSTFKVLAASAILQRSAMEGGMLQRRIAYAKAELVAYSPITEKHVGAGLTVA